MKTRNKGNRIQLRCISSLVSVGFLVGKVELRGKFVKVKDLFGLFDLVCVNRFGLVKFVQITCNRPHPHCDYVSFVRDYPVCCEQWVWYDNRGWKKFCYDNSVKGYFVIDDRK